MICELKQDCHKAHSTPLRSEKSASAAKFRLLECQSNHSGHGSRERRNGFQPVTGFF